MKKVIDIALKDMTQYFRSMIALVMMFAVPILLVGMFYVMFGGSQDEDQSFELPVTQVIVVNQDAGEIQLDANLANIMPDSLLSNAPGSDSNSMGDFLTRMLQYPEFANLMYVTVMDTPDQAKIAIDNQEAGIAILIPENFTEAFTDPEREATIEFYQDPGLTLGPDIVKGVVQQLLDNFSTSQITLQVTFEQIFKDGVEIDDGASQSIVSAYFEEMFGQRPDLNPIPLLNVQNPAGEEVASFTTASLISMMMTGMTVFYVFFTGASTAQSLISEEEKGTLSRLFTTPTPRATVLSGKLLSGILMIVVQVSVLMIFGNLVFKIEWGRLATLIPIVVATTLAASTFGIFMISWAQTERQAGLMIGGLVTITGMLGMLPIFVFSMPNPPQIVATLSHLVPQGWAVEGLQIAMEGGNPSDVLNNSIVLLAWAAVFFTIGVLRFRKRFA